MPLAWSLSIVAVVVVAVVVRFVVPGVPRVEAVGLTAGELALAGLGVVGLVAHCGAMFYTSVARDVPGAGRYVSAVNGMGLASGLLYAVPALVLLLGLRRIRFPALPILVLLLVGVGVTMYDNGPLDVHLTSILGVVVTLAATGALLVRRASAQPRP